MARKRRRSSSQAGELNLTAMIDVAFQLLSFFIITVKPIDVMVHLNVSRPSPDAAPKQQERPLNVLRIKIFPDGGYDMNGQPTTKENLDSVLTYLAKLDKEQTVLILCTSLSPHSKLIEVLDVCAKAGLVSLSVVSAD